MLDKEALLKLYPEYDTAYGPIFHGTEQRKFICLYSKITKKRTTISQAKAILQVRIGRLLLSNEEADHINEDPYDDSPENLQVLTATENRRKSNTKEKIKLICRECGNTFFLLPSQYKTRQKRGSALCCDRSCAAAHQMRGSKRTKSDIEFEYVGPGGKLT